MCYDRRFMALYDEKFNLIREITHIDNQAFIPKSFDMDTHGNVYISLKWINSNADTIVKLNRKLEFLKSFEKNVDKESLGDVCVYDEKLYVCLTNVKRVDIFSLDLEVISKNKLEMHPLQIRIADGIACVMVDFKKTLFYKLPTFEQISSRNMYGPIFAYENSFYVYENDGFSKFDNSGNFVEKQKTRLDMLGYHASGIALMKDSILMCFVKKICKLKLRRVC